MRFFKNISSEKLLILYVLIIILLSAGIISAVFLINLKNLKKTQDSEIHKLFAEKYSEKITAEFEQIILISQFSSRYNDINYTNKLSEILKSNNKLEGLYLFSGKTYLNSNTQNNLLQDTSQNFKNLTLYKINNQIISSPINKYDFSINKFDITKLNKRKEILISEPFKINIGKKSEYIIGITSSVTKNNKAIGYITLFYNIKTFTSILTANNHSQCNFILLSPEKIIIANSKNTQSIGKNILTLHNKERNLYNKLLQSEKKNQGHILKITLKNTDLKFELLSSEILTSNKHYKYLQNQFIIFFIVLIIAIIFLYYQIKQSFLPLKKIIKTSNQLSFGIQTTLKTEDLKIEYKQTAKSLNKISDFYTDIIAFSEQIISENYDTHLNERSEFDHTTKALNKISDYLKDKKLKQTREEEETSRQLWMRKGRFEISEAERFSSKDIHDLTYNIIRSVVNYIDALMGGIYLYDKENEKIELISAYAYETQKHINASFKPGEGIVGACILERNKVILNHIPDDYIKIATGLGSGTPTYIVVIPIVFKNEINAAIEVAFMNKPEDYKVEFIEQLSDSIGAWIDASLVSTKTVELLDISQSQTQKLAEKEEELNKKVSELQEIQEKTSEINTRYESMLNAVNQSIMTVEYTLDGTIINCNLVYTDIMGFKADDIKGKNVSELVKDQAESLKQIIEEVKNGKTISKEVKRYTATGIEKNLSATYTPYYNKNGKITQILFFAFDNSKTHQEK